MSDKFNARKGLEIGRGLAEDATIEVKNSSANFPYVKYSETEQVWKFSNDGTTENEFGSGGSWGEITGTLSDQTDLQNALDTKLNSADNLIDVDNQQTALNNITAVSGATDEYVLTKDTVTGDATWKEVVSSDELIKVSANDMNAGYLEDKIAVSSGTNDTSVLEVSTINEGADEDLQIQLDETKINHDNLSNVNNVGSGVSKGHISDEAETIYGVKTFNSFPVTPSTEPTQDYEIVNKKYVDDNTIPDSVADGNIYARRDNVWEQITTAVPTATIAKAWVNFNGTTSPSTIRSSYNVSSITDNGVGNYTINFTNAMNNSLYVVTSGTDTDRDGASDFDSSAIPRSIYIREDLKTTGSFRVSTGYNSSGGGIPSDKLDFRGINLIVFGN